MIKKLLILMSCIAMFGCGSKQNSETQESKTATKSVKITLGEKGIGFTVTKDTIDFTNQKYPVALIATGVKKDTVTLARATIVPAGEVLVIKGIPNKKYTIPKTNKPRPSGYTNLFKMSDGTYTVKDGDIVYSIKAKENRFGKVAAGITIPKGVPYVKLEK